MTGTPHPYRLALLLGASTIVGLVGLMLLDGWWELPAFLASIASIAVGLAGFTRSRRRTRP